MRRGIHRIARAVVKWMISGNHLIGQRQWIGRLVNKALLLGSAPEITNGDYQGATSEKIKLSYQLLGIFTVANKMELFLHIEANSIESIEGTTRITINDIGLAIDFQSYKGLHVQKGMEHIQSYPINQSIL